MDQPDHPHKDRENAAQGPEFRHLWIGHYGAGIFTTETYIPISASFDPDLTKPVIGGFRGKAKSTMETAVDIELNDE